MKSVVFLCLNINNTNYICSVSYSFKLQFYFVHYISQNSSEKQN